MLLKEECMSLLAVYKLSVVAYMLSMGACMSLLAYSKSMVSNSIISYKHNIPWAVHILSSKVYSSIYTVTCTSIEPKWSI